VLKLLFAILACLAFAGGAALAEGGVKRTHGISIIGEPQLPPDFKNFPYVNPDAPKGGEVALGAVGTFDSFNPFIVRGTPAGVAGDVYDTLLRANADEASTAYGLLAQTIEVPDDRSYVAFELRPEARFRDNTPVTAEDVVWTFNALREQGRPFFRQYYSGVADAVAESPARVVFHFKTTKNRELPFILGEMSVLPKHWWQGRDFSRPLTEPPLGSGPYEIDHFEFGRTISLRRVPDYWAANLPTAKGLNNFDVMRTEYFRDASVLFEAFKAGQIDLRTENISKQWATAYDFPAIRKGLVKKEEFRHHLPTGMQGFVMNTRRDLFKDRRVREALALVFDFQWANANLFYNAYTRTESYFSNSEFASEGLPSPAELALLDPYKAELPAEIFTEPFKLPVTDGSGNNRDGLRRALALLKEAGWSVKDRKLVDAAGKPFSFEILLDQPAFERVANPYVQWLSRLGIDARVRTVDPAQYEKLTDTFDFDMTVGLWGESESPGNEQVGYWTCAAAKAEASQNLTGVCDPAVDALVGKIVDAGDRDELIAATGALDRVLLNGWYVVPHWHQQATRVAFWDRFVRPSQPVRTGFAFDSWWLDPVRAAATDAARHGGE